MSIATPPSSSTSTTPATPPSTSASASASGAASVGASSSSSATGSTTSSGSGGGSSWGARIVGGLGSVMATVLSPLEPTSAAAVMDANDATGGASGGGGSGRPHTPTTASQHPRQLSSSPTTGHAISGASASGKSSKQGQSFLSFVMDAVSASPVQQPPKPEPEKRQPPPSSASVAVSPAATLVPVLEPSHTTPTPGEASAKAEATPAQATAPSGGIGLLRSISSAAASAAATAANATTLAVGTTLSVVSYGSDNAAKLARSYSNKLQQQVSPLISIPSVTPAQETPIVPADPFYKQRELMSALEETLRTTRLGLKADFRAGNIQRSQLLTGAAVLSDVVQLPPFNPHFREEDHPLTPEQKKALYNIGSALIPQKVDNFTFIPDLVSLLLHVLPVDQAFLASNILLHHSATHSDSLTTIKYFPATTKERSEGFLIFKDAILEHLPSFHSRMTELSIAVEEFAGTWFDRLFVGTLPYNLVLRLMDCFLCEGRSILYQAGLSILYLVSKRFLPETHTHDSLILALLQPMILGSEVPDEKEFMNVVFSYPSIVRRVKASATNLLVENPSKILDDNQFTKLWSWIPARNHISVPEVRFSALRDGFSLQRLYDVCTDIVPLVIIVKSARGNVFGAYIADALHVKPGGFQMELDS
ncbi:hypothetical protein Pelo_6935 [Pelomyxa schiedti]|nr:hypothetical protein Pelo_6935 [Pelomyxa schiedti]